MAEVPESGVLPTNATDEDDDVDDQVPLSDDEFPGVEDEHLADDDTVVMGRAQVPDPDDADWHESPVVKPVTADGLASMPDQAPWWVDEGEKIDAIVQSDGKMWRERHRRLGAPAGHDAFWDHVDPDPVSVVPTVQDAKVALHLQDFALQHLRMPRPPTLMVGMAIAAAAAFGIVGGSLAHRLAASATSLVFGVLFTMVVLRFNIPPRLVAVGAGGTAVACVAVSAVPAIHVTRWYGVLLGLAFAGAGIVIAALWPISQGWSIEKDHWKRPDVALVAALLKFGDCVEADPAPQDRRRAVAALDRAATRFEIAWHRVNRTGVDITDRQLRGWAGRIRAETRELQRRVAFGDPGTFALLMHIYELIQAIVNRYSLDGHEDAWIRNGS